MNMNEIRIRFSAKKSSSEDHRENRKKYSNIYMSVHKFFMMISYDLNFVFYNMKSSFIA